MLRNELDFIEHKCIEEYIFIAHLIINYLYLSLYLDFAWLWFMNQTIQQCFPATVCLENLPYLYYILDKNTYLRHSVIKHLVNSIWGWFSEIKCKYLLIYKAKWPALMTRCLISLKKLFFLHIKKGWETLLCRVWNRFQAASLSSIHASEEIDGVQCELTCFIRLQSCVKNLQREISRDGADALRLQDAQRF